MPTPTMAAAPRLAGFGERPWRSCLEAEIVCMFPYHPEGGHTRHAGASMTTAPLGGSGQYPGGDV